VDVISYVAPSIDPALVKPLSATLVPPAPMSLSFGGLDAAMSVLSPTFSMSSEFEHYLVSCVLGTIPFDFEVNADALASFVEKRLPGTLFHEATGDYRALVLDFTLHESQLMLLGKDIGPFSISSVTRGRASSRSAICDLSITSSSGEIYLKVFGTEISSMAFQRLCKAAPKAEVSQLSGTSEVVLVAGLTDLTIAELRQIKLGQGVIFDTTLLNQGRVIARVGERPIATCTVSPGRAVVERAFEEAGVALLVGWKRDTGPEDNMTDELTQDTSLDSIKVRLNFELGRTEISLADLSKLTPGHVFALPARPDEAIDVTVGGRIVARGAIVQIGPQLGVRITRMGL
jgi:flagellar motor switch/type III secretory pathway protein FliN